MPSAFVGVIVKSKRETANRMVNTCFTFAGGYVKHEDRTDRFPWRRTKHSPATVMLKGPTFPFAEKLTILRPKAILPLTSSTKILVKSIPRAYDLLKLSWS